MTDHAARPAWRRTAGLALVLAAAVAAAPVARAQAAPPARPIPAAPDSVPTSAPVVFAYVQLGDTIAYEAVRSDSTVVRGAYLVPGQGRVAWDHLLVNGVPDLLRLAVFPEGGPDLFPVRETEYVRRDSTMLVIDREAREERRDSSATVAGAVPAFGRSMTHLAYLALYAVQARLSSLPLFLTSSGKTVRAVIEPYGESLTIRVDGLRIESDWRDGVLVEIRIPGQGLVVHRLAPPAG